MKKPNLAVPFYSLGSTNFQSRLEPVVKYFFQILGILIVKNWEFDSVCLESILFLIELSNFTPSTVVLLVSFTSMPTWWVLIW